MNLLFWGTQSLFAQHVLCGLCDHHALQAVMVPASPLQPDPIQPLHSPPEGIALGPQLDTTTGIAEQLGLPIYGIRRLHHKTIVPFLRSFAPDLVCVACFPWRIPPALLAIPTFGFVNLHPSLLPAYRGPAPLFWQLRDGLRISGLTAHWMDANFDTGDIVAQQPLALPEGAGGPEIDVAMAGIGVALLDSLLRDLVAGNVPRRPQPRGGTTHSWPTAADFALDPAWSACQAFCFMRGTAEWQQPYSVTHGTMPLTVDIALAYDTTARLPQPVVEQSTQVAIQFNPGVLYATPTPSSTSTTAQRFPLDLLL